MASPEPFTIAMGMAGGLALFLYGMEQMAESLKLVAGSRMRQILARLTVNRFAGVFTGAFVTSVIQSSSVTTVLVVGFISAGLLTLSQSVGVIMGANIGTTITAQIIAFKVTKYAMLLVAVGYGTSFLARRETVRQYGVALLGLGLVFAGMGLMGDAMQPLRTWQPFLDLMARMENPLLALAVAAAFTGLIQSSSAATGIVIVLAQQGFVSLEAGIALVLGTNIGTCITAVIAAIGRPREAGRAAAVHVTFNVVGALLWVGLIDQLAQASAWLSPGDVHLEGMDRLAANTPRQIANAHTIFNVANTVLFLPFTGLLATFVEWLLPDRPLHEAQAIRARYLDADLLETPALALERARLELERMARRVREMLERVVPAALSGTPAELTEVRDLDDEVDALHVHLVHYLGQISRKKLTEPQTAEFSRLIAAANDIESIGDIIETNIVNLGLRRAEVGVVPSAETTAVIEAFHEEVQRAYELSATVAWSGEGLDDARAVVKMKGDIKHRAEEAGVHETVRLVADAPHRAEAYRFETDLLENLRRIYYFAKRMARTSLRAAKAG